MSDIGRWNLWIGLGLVAAALVFRAFDLIPVTVIVGLIGLLGIGVAGYDALYEWQGRVQLRRRGAKAKARRERERQQGL